MLGAGENAQQLKGLAVLAEAWVQFQHPHDGSQLLVIPVPGTSGTLSWPLRALHAHGAQIYRQQTLTRIQPF